MTAKNTLQNNAPLRGDLCVRVRDVSTDKVLRRFEIRNKILNSGYAAILQMLDDAAVNTGNFSIARIRIGTGATVPDVTQTDVAAPISASGVAYPFNKVDFIATKTQSTPPLYELVVSATIPGGVDGVDAYNGKVITEAALILGSGLAFAKQVHPSVTKTSAIAIDYEWHVRLVAAA